MSRELDAEVAEKVMGWKLTITGFTEDGQFSSDFDLTMHSHHGIIEAWRPSTNIKDAWEMESFLLNTRRGQDNYSHCLMQVVGREVLPGEQMGRCGECARNWPAEEYHASILDLVHASPKQRCLAALKAVSK